MEISAHVQTAIGVASPISEEELSVAADAWPGTQATFGLSGNEFAAAVANVQNGGTIAVLRPKRVHLTSWRYLELNNAGVFEGWFVSTPSSEVGPPPTAAGQALVMAWMLDPAVVKDGITPGLLLYKSVSGATLARFISQFASQWCDACFFLHDVTLSPPWVTKGRIDIGPDSRLTNAVVGSQYEKLFLEVVSEIKDKWRFLSLYRILEHGYLTHVFDTLAADFFNRPEASLNTALKMVKSELNQFVALAEKASLQNEFKNFFDEFEKSKAGGNELALAIEHSIRQAGQQSAVNGQWQMGILFCYKLRNSIVHAGSASPIFDTYADGPALMEAVLPVCESIVLNFLSVTVT